MSEEYTMAKAEALVNKVIEEAPERYQTDPEFHSRVNTITVGIKVLQAMARKEFGQEFGLTETIVYALQYEQVIMDIDQAREAGQ